ncbi:MAG TPA: metallophosphoesterase family protein [Bryobacteraceae bacterium]|nr:metallophosphoesterase family protein [Bryobacteraceae bacterium]
MRFLILSDLHSNLQALEAVVEHAAGAYDQVLCLGDVVGYCADPNPVTDWIRQHAAAIVRGNHDRACTGDAVIECFSGPAQFAALWTYGALNPENREWLQELPQGPVAIGDFFLVHGSPKDEDDYLLNKCDAAEVSRHMPGAICFFGHTHVQGGFAMRRGRTWLIPHPKPKESHHTHQLEPDTSYLLNPGSAGQPRDGDPRAAYAIFEMESKVITFCRAPYDVATAQDRIRKAKLPYFLADRLSVGR